MQSEALGGEFGIFITFHDRQVEVIFHGEKAGDDYGCSTGKTARDGMQMAQSAQPEGYAAMHAGKGIDFCAEDEGNLVEKDIANNATSGSRQRAHYDSYPHGLSGCKGFLNADNGKHAETKSVEEEPSVVAADDVPLKAPHKKQGQKGDAEVDGVLHPKDGYAEHHIAQSTAANGCGETYNEGTKEVEVLGRGQTNAGDGESQRANVVEGDDEVVVEGEYVGLEFLFHWPKSIV